MVTRFHAPESVERALELRAEHGDRARFLGGGTELNALDPPCRPQQLISLQRLGLRSISVEDDQVLIGACCTLQEMIEAPDVPEVVRLACRNVASRAVRNQATIGGHIAAAHRYASVLPILVALAAEVDTVSPPGTATTMPVAQRIAAGEQSLITALRISRFAADRRAGVAEHKRSSNDLALLTVAVALRLDGERLHDPAVVIGGIVERAMRLPAVEQLLTGKPLPDPQLIEAAVGGALPDLRDEPRAGSAFKRYLAGVLVADTLRRAIGGAS